MAIDRKKLGALVDKHSEQKAPPKKPGGGGGGPPADDGKDASPDGEPDGDEPADDAGDADMAQQQAARIANGNGDEELMALADGVDPESEEVPEFALDADVWERAKAAVRALDQPPADEDVMAVIIHTYDAIGGALAGGDDAGDVGDDDAGGDDPDPGADPFAGGE